MNMQTLVIDIEGMTFRGCTYLAAGTSPRRLGATRGGIAAASGLAQVSGSAAGGSMFGKLAQSSFAWLSRLLILTPVVLLLRPELGTAAIRSAGTQPPGSRRTRRMNTTIVNTRS